jgi:hypothetical protein
MFKYLTIILTFYLSVIVQPASANQPEFFIKSVDTDSEIKAPRRSDYGDDSVC